jgi:hypothetical protein
MRTIALTLFVAVLASVGVAHAQTTTVELDELRAPTSPAFVLLDVTPAAVERPENPKAFTVNLINAVSKAKGLPQNYALEVAPYWLTYHPSLTFDKYQSPGAMSLIHTLSISVATTPMTPEADSTADPIGTRLGIGVRTNIRSGRFHPRLNQLVEDLKELHGESLDIINAQDPVMEAIKKAEEDLEAAKQGGQPAAIAAAEKALMARQTELGKLQAQEKALDSQTTTKALEIQALDAQRVGLIVALAAGKTWDVPQDDISLSQPGRWGVWLTPSYRFLACTASGECSASIDAIAVLRAMRVASEDTLWDAGGRLVWQPTKELRLSAETLRRWGGGSDAVAKNASTRTAAMLEYDLRENLSFYASFGRDFEKATGQKPLVSLLGLNVGLGKRPKVSVAMTE